MHKIKDMLKKQAEESPYDNAYGEYLNSPEPEEGQNQHIDHLGPNQELGEVVSERPVAVGIAEVPVVLAEQQGVTERAPESKQEVCGQKTFTEVEDRPVVRERVETVMEHRPVEKQYAVETKYVGEKELSSSNAEVVDVQERTVEGRHRRSL